VLAYDAVKLSKEYDAVSGMETAAYDADKAYELESA
jgi:hypothetical protein